jgi:hypothetical protein
MSFPTGTPTVEVDLDGPRTLGFTLGAMRRIKEATGTLEVDENATEETMLQTLPVYVWACMGAEDRADLSIEAIEDMIHPMNMVAINGAVTALFQLSVPKGAEGNDPVPPKVRRAAVKGR